MDEVWNRRADPPSRPDARRPSLEDRLERLTLLWQSRLSALKEDMAVPAFRERKLHAERLARERLESDLGRESERNRRLSRELEAARREQAVFAEELKKARDDAQREIALLAQNGRRLEADREASRAELSRAAQEIANLKEAQAKAGQEHQAILKGLRAQCDQAGEKQAEMAQRIAELNARLQDQAARLERLSRPPAPVVVVSAPEPEKRGLLRRISDWLNEPVLTLGGES